jgi:hypothetical protein
MAYLILDYKTLPVTDYDTIGIVELSNYLKSGNEKIERELDIVNFI